MVNVGISEPSSERVRGFALSVEEAGSSCVTAEALVTHVHDERNAEAKAMLEREKWRKWWRQSSSTVWDTDSDDAVLMAQCRAVSSTWKTFSKKASVNQALKSCGLTDLDTSNPPTIDTLQRALKGLQNTQEARDRTLWGRFRSNIVAFACSMNAHKHLFSIFPSESIYTSVLSGVVSSIVVACVSYEKAAEGFSEGLRRIGDDLGYLSRSRKSLDTPPIRKAVAAAYAEVFKFLCFAMEWRASRRRRLSASVQSDFYDKHVKVYITEIGRLAHIVQREIDLDAHDGVFDILDIAQTHNIPEQQNHTSDRFRNRDDQQKDDSFDMASKTFARIGYEIKHCLVAAEEQHDYDLVLLMRRSRSPDGPRALQTGQTEDMIRKQPLVASEDTVRFDEDDSLNSLDRDSMGISDKDESQGASLHVYARRELEELAQSLQVYVNNGISQALRSSLEDDAQSIASEVLHDIQHWMENNTSSLLWVEGPVFPTDLSPIALRVWGVFSTANIPCVAFFSQNRFPNPRKLDHDQAGVICLLYTLISQLIQQLPSVIESKQKLEEEYFAKLDGSWESAAFALDTVRHFLTYAPSSLVMVIHGLEAIESKTTRKVLRDLIDSIRDQGTESVVKILFTTNGMSHVLGKKTGRRERVDASRMAQGRPGRLLRGSSPLRELEIGG